MLITIGRFCYSYYSILEFISKIDILLPVLPYDNVSFCPYVRLLSGILWKLSMSILRLWYLHFITGIHTEAGNLCAFPYCTTNNNSGKC